MMRSATIHRLGDVRRSDAVQVGGKAASLGELIAAGVRVPEGVVLGTEVADMSAGERALLLKTTVAELGDGPFAVRSSGVTEDGADRSFAGIYETVLDVTPDGLAGAVDRCLASAHARRAAAYRGEEDGRIAVIIQRMVRPAAAGVALTADPITGDRGTCIVTSVQGLAERLVSGAARGDEWVVNGKVTTARRQPEHALDRRQAGLIASEARRIAVARGLPQDIEWAIDAEGTLWLLQARPMTALPPEVSWEAPAPGAYTRTVRFGEWISEPVTPLFESWLLPAMEDVLHSQLRRLLGQRFPHPYHVVVNGWYFYSINFLSGKALILGLPSILWHLVRYPRHLAGVFPPLVRHSYPVFVPGCRVEMRPR
jgi:pyruvate,water dikinase